MQRKKHTAEFKAKMVLEVLKEEKTLNEIASTNQVNPNLVSRWKTEFIEMMPKIFTKESTEYVKMKKEYEETTEKLYMEIGKLTTQIEWLKKKSSRGV